MNAIYEEYVGQVVPLRIHTWWPGDNDCFWLFNEDANYDRILYYHGMEPWPTSLYVPSFRFEGEFIKDPSDSTFITYEDWYNFVRSTLDSLLAIPSPIRIANFTQTPLLDSVFVSFDVVADDPVTDARTW